MAFYRTKSEQTMDEKGNHFYNTVYGQKIPEKVAKKLLLRLHFMTNYIGLETIRISQAKTVQLCGQSRFQKI